MDAGVVLNRDDPLDIGVLMFPLAIGVTPL
jgi:hypothetical protein